MYRLLFGLLIAAVSLVALGTWWFFGEVVLVWVSLVGGFIKSISLKMILTELLALLTRWLFVELPKRFLILLVIIGLPAIYRRKIKHFLWRSRQFVRRVAERVKHKVTLLTGERTALAISIITTVVIALLGFLSFGFYFVWIVGGNRMWYALKWAVVSFWFYSKNIIFRIVMFTHLYRFWQWVMNTVPKHYASAYRQKKHRAFRTTRESQQRLSRLALRSFKKLRVQKTEPGE